MIKTLMTKLSYLLLIFLIACNPLVSQISTPTSLPKNIPTIEPSQIPTVIATPSPNILELSSAGQTLLPTYKRECVDSLHPIPNTEAFQGTLAKFLSNGVAIFTDKVNDENALILFDLKTGAKRRILADVESAKWEDLPEVSPDRKWLFYLAGLENSSMGDSDFVLANSNGEIVKQFPVSLVKHRGYEYLFVHEWLGNDALRLLSRKNSNDKDLVVLLFDPFREQLTELKNDFNGLQSPVVKYAKTPQENHQYLDLGVDPFFDVIIFLLKGANVSYNRTKSLVFYPHQDGYDVLYDVSNHKELAQVMIPQWGELPKWSPTGNFISIIATPPNAAPDSAKKDFYLLSTDGKTIRRLTYLSEQLERVSIKEYAWSPDGSKIAFWLNTNFPAAEDEVVPYELAVVDVMNGNITNYCFAYHSGKVKELAEHAGLLIEPVWSPDGNQLLIPSRIPAKVPSLYHSYDVKTFLFDPQELSAIEIMESVLIHGWMTNDQ